MKNANDSTNLKLTIFLRLMEVTIQSIVFISLTAMLLLGAIGMPDHDLWKCFLVIIPVVMTYLIRRYITKFQIHIIFYVLITASGMLIGQNESERFFITILLLVLVAYSYRMKMVTLQKVDLSRMLYTEIETGFVTENMDEKKRILYANEQMSIYFGAFMVIGYMIGHAVDSAALRNMEVVLFVLFVLLQVIYHNIKTLNSVFLQYIGKSEFPAAQIKRVNSFIIVTLVLLMFIGMMLFYHGEYGNIFEVIGAGGMALLKFVLRIILKIWGSGKGSSTAQEETTTAALSDEDLLETADPYQPSAAAQAIIVAFSMLVFTAAMIALVVVLVRFIKNFNKTRKENKDLVEYVKPETVKSTRSKKLNRDSAMKDKSNRSRFRKYFKKRVKKGYGAENPDPTRTPYELTKKAITPEDDKAEQISQIYEKARYSDEPISEEEVKMIKNLP